MKYMLVGVTGVPEPTLISASGLSAVVSPIPLRDFTALGFTALPSPPLAFLTALVGHWDEIDAGSRSQG